MSGPVGVVLAGGLSRRMGRDKALLEVDGETLVGRACRRLRAVCPEVAVADNGRRLIQGAPSLRDGAGRGPAAGILGAGSAYPGRPLLVLACDLPGIPACLLELLAGPDALGGSDSEKLADWLLPRWRAGSEPLCALWGTGAVAALALQVERGEMALHSLSETSTLRIRYLEEADLLACGEPEEMFQNLNRPQDLERLISIGRRSTAEPPSS